MNTCSTTSVSKKLSFLLPENNCTNLCGHKMTKWSICHGVYFLRQGNSQYLTVLFISPSHLAHGCLLINLNIIRNHTIWMAVIYFLYSTGLFPFLSSLFWSHSSKITAFQISYPFNLPTLEDQDKKVHSNMNMLLHEFKYTP